MVVEKVVVGGPLIASPEKNVPGGARSNEGRALIKIPSHLVKAPDMTKYVFKHVASVENFVPDPLKTTVCKNKAAKKSIVGTCTKTKENGAEAASGEVETKGWVVDGMTITVLGEVAHEVVNSSTRIGLEIATFFTFGPVEMEHRISCEVPSLKESLILSATTGGGATGTEPVLPPNSTGMEAYAAETSDKTSGLTDRESLETP